MSDLLALSEETLQALLENQYDLINAELVYLPLGLDFSAAVYRVRSEQGYNYLLKVTSRPLYEPRYLVPRYLYDQGIMSCAAPVCTKNGTLWTQIGNWTVAMYPFLSGESSFHGMLRGHWKKLGAVMRQIHHMSLPSEISKHIRQENFDVAGYIGQVRKIEEESALFEGGGNVYEEKLRAVWAENTSKIHGILTSMAALAEQLRMQKNPCVICHADLHPANIIRDQSGNVHVIDWDEVMLAPKERDFIFVRPPYHDAFFDGYGEAGINEDALTYYRFERDIQDLIECANIVCHNDAKQSSLQLFQDILCRY